MGRSQPPVGRRVEYTPLDDIRPADRNPRHHDLDGIRASIGRFGFVGGVIHDERTGRLVAGHGRLAALTTMRDAGQQPPDGVQVDGDGRWLVPVQRGWASRSDAEADAYLVADNRWTEKAAWDDEGLAELLASIGETDPDLVAIAGFDDDELAELLAGPDVEELPPAGLTDPDDVPDAPAEPVSKPGDVWLLGKHRVLCGDSTDVAAVEAMLTGDRADCMWTDPPYGVDYVGKTKDALTIKNDGSGGLPELLAGAFAVATAALKPGAAVYVAHPPGPNSLVFAEAINAAGWSLRQQLIWDKGVMVLGHSDYHYRHEPIWMAYTDGGKGRRGRGGDSWYGDHSQVSVFEVPKPPRSEAHPTMKPVELIVAMLSNSCPPRGLVYEPFGGSGSTLIAAQRLGMRAAVVELDPRYVDVICRRFQEHTGITPILEATGKPHDFTGGD